MADEEKDETEAEAFFAKMKKPEKKPDKKKQQEHESYEARVKATLLTASAERAQLEKKLHTYFERGANISTSEGLRRIQVHLGYLKFMVQMCKDDEETAKKKLS